MPDEATLKNIRIMEPIVRRALEPGVPSASAAASYTADMIRDVTADAFSMIQFAAGPDWPYYISVIERNPTTCFPEEFATNEALPYEVQSLVGIQAALQATLNELTTTLKMRETIKDEGSEWTYEKSVNLLRDKIKALQDDRNEAIRQMQRAVAPLEQFVNLIAQRVPLIDQRIEPYYRNPNPIQ